LALEEFAERPIEVLLLFALGGVLLEEFAPPEFDARPPDEEVLLPVVMLLLELFPLLALVEKVITGADSTMFVGVDIEEVEKLGPRDATTNTAGAILEDVVCVAAGKAGKIELV
jgi:hypothetical protein